MSLRPTITRPGFEASLLKRLSGNEFAHEWDDHAQTVGVCVCACVCVLSRVRACV